MTDTVIAELMRHSVAEEMYVYPAMRDHLPDGESKVQHDIEEHQQLEEVMKELEGLDAADSRFLEALGRLEQVLRDHVSDEETEHFPELRAQLPREQLVELGRKGGGREEGSPDPSSPSGPAQRAVPQAGRAGCRHGRPAAGQIDRSAEQRLTSAAQPPGRPLQTAARSVVGLSAPYGRTAGQPDSRKARLVVQLTGRVALVTGASRGLGVALARELLRRGCRVAVCARDPEELERARPALAEDGDVLAIPCDVADREQVEDLVSRTVDRFGSLDVLITNAGVIQVGPLPTMRVGDFEDALGVMFWGPCCPRCRRCRTCAAPVAGS